MQAEGKPFAAYGSNKIEIVINNQQTDEDLPKLLRLLRFISASTAVMSGLGIQEMLLHRTQFPAWWAYLTKVLGTVTE